MLATYMTAYGYMSKHVFHIDKYYVASTTANPAMGQSARCICCAAMLAD